MKSKTIFIALFLVVLGPTPLLGGEMDVKKVVLGQFDVKDGEIVLNTTDPDWRHIDRHNLTVDDRGRIYVLNIRNAEILVFNDAGKVLKKISLPDKRFDKAFPRAGYLEVNGNGNKFLVELPSRGSRREKNYSPPRRFVIDQNGKVLREISGIQPFPDIRLCDNTYWFMQAPYIYDENFDEIGEGMPAVVDAEGNYFKPGGGRLIKYSEDGIPLSAAPIPDPFPSLTQEEKDHWEYHSSEEIFSMFKLACNGDVYLIYQLGELPALTLNRWLEKGEYFIYKFESKK